MFYPDRFLSEWIKNTVDNKQQVSKEELRAQLLLKLGLVPTPATATTHRVIETVACEGYTRERVVFQTAEHLPVPVYVLTPHLNKARFPGVLALHGHGAGSRELVGLTDKGLEVTGDPGIHQRFAVQLVKRGFKVFVLEVLGFGERILVRDVDNKNNSCFGLAAGLLMAGSTLAGMRTFEARRTVDLMQTFKDVQSEQIGIFGFSGGALVASLTAALDQRIQATVLSGFANTYQDSILAMDHCIDNYIPTILNLAELPEMIGLISPRKLFIEAGAADPIFPIHGVKAAIEQLKEQYEKQKANNHFDYDIFQGAHIINGEKALPWLEDALR
ncbi:dienelactone hydrolase family protein [Alkalicoccobacillus porphyridii]|nr:alpha/beta hydrolase family protein [Alkalicoccobacillus porphyridii]